MANPSGQIPSALNAAVRASRHPVIVRVDARSRLPAGYIAAAVRALHETGAVNVGGVMAAEGITPFQRAVAWAMTSPAGVGSARFHTGGSAGPSESVYLGTFRREAIEGVGGYDEQYLRGEDWEMNHRIRQAGGLIWFQPELRVTYRPRTTVRALASQYFLYGRWRRAVARQHAGTITLRYLAPPAALVALLIGTLAGLAGVASLADRTGHLVAVAAHRRARGPARLRDRRARRDRAGRYRREAERARGGLAADRAGDHAPELGSGVPDQSAAAGEEAGWPARQPRAC